MKLVIMPSEPFPALLVRDTPAANAAIAKLCEGPVQPGQVISFSDEEFEALKEDILAFRVPAQE